MIGCNSKAIFWISPWLESIRFERGSIYLTTDTKISQHLARDFIFVLSTVQALDGINNGKNVAETHLPIRRALLEHPRPLPLGIVVHLVGRDLCRPNPSVTRLAFRHEHGCVCTEGHGRRKNGGRPLRGLHLCEKIARRRRGEKEKASEKNRSFFLLASLA